ncbi:MAG: hypothetical protein HPY51_20145 [Candidatus Omnitrophica bacterium]|nr:hypothetical protein [Candidatus Omnitrophota bacterium]
MSIQIFILRQREEILRIAGKHGALNMRIFGSVARGETNDSSDDDLLVHVSRSRLDRNNPVF